MVLRQEGWRMTRATQFAFSVGGAPAQVSATIIAFFLTPFLLETVGLRANYVAFIMMIGRLCDAVSDPAVGFLSDHTVSRFGRRRPWIMGSILPLCFVYIGVFFSPEIIGIPLESQEARFAYYCTFCSLFSIVISVNFVPYTALTMELSEDPRERDSATAWRMVCEVLATVVGVVLQSFMIAELGPDMGDQDGCVLGGGIEIPEPEPEGGSLTRREQMQLAFLWCALAVSVIMVVTSLITAIWVPERPQFTRRPACCKIWWGEKWIKKEKEDAAFFANGGAVDGLRDSEKAMWKGEGGRGEHEPLLASEAEAKAAVDSQNDRLRRSSVTIIGGRQDGLEGRAKDESLLGGLRAAWQCKAYVMLNVTYLMTWLCFQILAGNLILYLCYAVDVYDEFEYIVGTVMISTVTFLAIMFKAMKYIEKPTCYRIGLMAFVPFGLALFFMPKKGTERHGIAYQDWMIYVISAGVGMGIGTCFLLPWAMLPDTVDASELLTGARHEGLFFSLFVFFGKLAAGIGLGATNFILDAAGYSVELGPGEVQPDSVLFALRVLCGLVPTALAVLSMILLFWYPIDEVTRVETRKTLERRNALPSRKGSVNSVAQANKAPAGGGGGNSAAAAVPPSPHQVQLKSEATAVEGQLASVAVARDATGRTVYKHDPMRSSMSEHEENALPQPGFYASQALRDGLEHLPEPLVSLPTALDDHVLAPQAVSSSSGAPVLPTVPGGGS